MYSETWDSKNGSINLYELRIKHARLFENDNSSCDREVTIKPRMPYTSSVCLHTDLKICRFTALWNGPNLASIRKQIESGECKQYQVLLSSLGCPHGSRRCSDPYRVANSVEEWTRSTQPDFYNQSQSQYLCYCPMDWPCEIISSTRSDIFLPVICFFDLIDESGLQSRSRYNVDLSTFRKPAFSKRMEAFWTAWKGVGDAFTNLRNRVAASGLAG